MKAFCQWRETAQMAWHGTLKKLYNIGFEQAWRNVLYFI